MVCPAFRDTAHSWQVAAGESGTCTRGLRISSLNVPTFLGSVSSPRVRLRSNEYSGLPSDRLAISPSVDAGMFVPSRKVALAGVHMSPLTEHSLTAYVGIDWADTKHDST